MAGRNQGDLRPLLEKARGSGCTVDHTKSGHYKVTAPNGNFYVVSSTPGSAKAIYRLRSFLRHQGIETRAA